MRPMLVAEGLAMVLAATSGCSSATTREGLGPTASVNDVVDCIVHLAEARGWTSSRSGVLRSYVTLEHPDDGRISVVVYTTDTGAVRLGVSSFQPATSANLQLRENIRETCSPRR
jgi:hypothetical protein